MAEQPQNQPVMDDRGYRHDRRNNGGWIAGIILIIIGVVFLLQNTIGFRFDNWWALFILFPAFGSFQNAYRMYEEDGRLSGRARGQAVSGLVFIVIAVAFLLGGFGRWWPLLLIFGGLVMLVNALLPD